MHTVEGFLTESGRVQVIVAVVGVMGALGTALFANWDKIFTPNVPPEISRRVDATPSSDAHGATDSPLPKGYAILFNSFDKLDPAQDSMKAAKAAGFDGGVIFFKYTKYRPALVFPTADVANTQLSQVRSKLNGSAYVRDLGTWCPGPISGARGFLTCANNGVF